MLLLALTACEGGPLGGGDVATYDLTLNVLSPSNQAPFDGLDSLVLRLEHAAGEPEDYELSSTTGSPQVTGLSDLDGTRLALLGYSGGELVSYGKTEAITAHDETDVSATVFVSELANAAWLTLLEQPSALGAVASDGLGSFWRFGGQKGVYWNDGIPSDAVMRLDIAPPDDLAFHDAGSMPDFEGENSGASSDRVGHSATLLTGSADDAGMILIAGGHEQDLDFLGTSKTAWLFDPVSGDWIEPENSMRAARSGHQAVEFQNGDVLLFGGWGTDASPGTLPRMPITAEIYRRGERKFEKTPSALDDEYLSYGAAASLGSPGILHCGGFEISSSLWSSTDRCVLVDVSGAVTEVEPLPTPVAHLAMVPLGEGQAMAIGGVAASALDFKDAGAGSGETWIYDAGDDTWTPAGDLKVPRGGLVAAALPDGSVLAIGGNENMALYGDSGPMVACAELWDGSSWSLLDGCSAGDESGSLPGAVYWPSIATDPDYGVLVVGGLDAGNKATDGVTFWPAAPAL
ncbi:MAG: hypothetical protein GY884_05005 [Proteobacteria bacterium]|nr:hypothetical protein [Pseudomonadota bacterium]